MTETCHCEEAEGRRSNLCAIDKQRLLRFARNDIATVVLALFVVICIVSPAFAVRPDEMLVDPALEARARGIGKELRCLVCQNQSVDDSDADLAHDLRMLVRERLKAGDSDVQVVAYVRARYGDFVLLRPPLQVDTLLLWGGPMLILLLGAIAIFRFYRLRSGIATDAPPLSDGEQARLAQLLEAGGER